MHSLMMWDIARVWQCHQEVVKPLPAAHHRLSCQSLLDLLIQTVQQRKVSLLQRRVVRNLMRRMNQLQELNHNFPHNNLKTTTSSLLRCKHSSLARIHLFSTRRLSFSKTMNLRKHRKRSVDWSNHTLQILIKVLFESTMRTESRSSLTYSSLRVKPT